MLVLSPAYGRDYKSKAEVLADFNAGKDFVNETSLFTGGGRYVNKPQLTPGESVQIRYARMRKALVTRA